MTWKHYSLALLIGVFAAVVANRWNAPIPRTPKDGTVGGVMVLRGTEMSEQRFIVRGGQWQRN